MTCDEKLVLADDHGNNDCTFTCKEAIGHAGPHRDEFPNGANLVVVKWGDESAWS
jgi:hypothetical protein